MKKVRVSNYVENVISSYPKHRYGSACAIFDEIGDLVHNLLKKDNKFSELMQGLLDVGFDNVDFSIGLHLDDGKVNIVQSLLRGEVDDSNLSS